MPDQVMIDFVVGMPPVASCVATLMAMVLAVTVAVPEVKVSSAPEPADRVTVAVTVAAGLNSNPAGAFKTIVPVPMSRFADSVIAGPATVVYVPVPATEASADKLVVANVETDTVPNPRRPPANSRVSRNKRVRSDFVADV